SQKGAYRLLDNAAVSHEGLSAPHWAATRQRAGQSGRVVLMVQDITHLDYTAHEGTQGPGPIGNHPGQGSPTVGEKVEPGYTILTIVTNIVA
ncbi:MAG TPA: hypothetical protein VKT82_34275, partial [Ktedonobacterales bacterium]|nr:hypothetical protein [Ktedonobacterales bacterium]